MFDQKIYQACKKKDEIFSTLTVKKNNDKKEKRLCCILFRYYSFESRVTSSHRRIRNENFSDFLSVLFCSLSIVTGNNRTKGLTENIEKTIVEKEKVIVKEENVVGRDTERKNVEWRDAYRICTFIFGAIIIF